MSDLINSKICQLTAEELTAFVRKEMFYRAKPVLLLTIVVFASIMVLSAYVYLAHHSTWFIESWGPLASLICLWWVLAFWYYPKSSSFARFTKRAIQPTSFTISSTEFSAQSNDGFSLKLPISGFYKIIERDGYFAFWENPSCAHFLPFRIFSAQDKSVISNIIKSLNLNTKPNSC